MKTEQKRKDQERRKILEERVGCDEHSGVIDERSLAEICKRYNERIRALEEQKYDLELEVRVKDYEVILVPQTL